MKRFLLVLLTLVLTLCMVSAHAEGKTFRVGIIQFVQHEALDAATQGFVDELQARLGDRVECIVQNASGDTANCATIANGFVSSGVDLIMANATPALQAAVGATADIPILGTSVTDYTTALELDALKDDGTTGLNVSGTSDLSPLDQQAAMIRAWMPDAKTVGLLFCSAEANSLFQVANMRKHLEALGFTCTDFAFTDSNDIASLAQQATACDVIYIPTDNTAAAYAETIGSVIEPAGIPCFTGEEGVAGQCGVATLTINYVDIGKETGAMAFEVLEQGAKVSEMPIRFAPVVTKKFNAAICEVLGLTAPEGYVAIQ